MEIICTVDLATAIRRGIDARGTVIIDVAPESLSQRRRDALADLLLTTEPPTLKVKLRGPSFTDLMDLLDEGADFADAKAEAEEQQRALVRRQDEEAEARRIKNAEDKFHARKTHYMPCVWLYCDTVGDEVRYGTDLPNTPTRGSASYSPVAAWSGAAVCHTTWARLLGSEEGVQWQKEIATENEQAAATCREEALEDHRRSVAQLALKARATAFRKGVVESDGTDMQKERLRRGLCNLVGESDELLRAWVNNPLDCARVPYDDPSGGYNELETIDDRLMGIQLAYEQANEAMKPVITFYRHAGNIEMDVLCTFGDGVTATAAFLISPSTGAVDKRSQDEL